MKPRPADNQFPPWPRAKVDPVSYTPSTGWLPGSAYVEQAGWEEDEKHGRRFVARLVFPAGPADLTFGVVWEHLKVKIEVQK